MEPNAWPRVIYHCSSFKSSQSTKCKCHCVATTVTSVPWPKYRLENVIRHNGWHIQQWACLLKRSNYKSTIVLNFKSFSTLISALDLMSWPVFMLVVKILPDGATVWNKVTTKPVMNRHIQHTMALTCAKIYTLLLAIFLIFGKMQSGPIFIGPPGTYVSDNLLCNRIWLAGLWASCNLIENLIVNHHPGGN